MECQTLSFGCSGWVGDPAAIGTLERSIQTIASLILCATFIKNAGLELQVGFSGNAVSGWRIFDYVTQEMHTLCGRSCLISVGMQDTSVVRVSPLGKLVGGSLGELRRAIEKARKSHKEITIDLSEVTLVDRHSLSFLVSLCMENVRLVNCPEYLAPWFERAKSSPELVSAPASE